MGVLAAGRRASRTCRAAKILFAEFEENNLGAKALNERWHRWYTCGLCEQDYHGVVRCALGWACWKTYGRDHTNLAITLFNLAVAHGSLGDNSKKRELLERGLVICEGFYGPDHSETEDFRREIAGMP